MNTAERQLAVKPDFIIIGAMKSGTTSLHNILSRHPGIHIPQGEVQLFSIDDIEQNPVFSRSAGEWVAQNFDRHFDDYNLWHQAVHKDALPGQLIGEDAPSYLPSKMAIDRIARFAPNSRLIIILRDPVKRLESHYWHWVRTHRAMFSLEDTLRFHPGTLLQRSHYEDQVRFCFERVPRENVHVVIFERFIRDQQATIEEVCRFLGVQECSPDEEGVGHSNKTPYPKNLSLALWRNRMLRESFGRRYLGRIPRLPEKSPLSWSTRSLLRLYDTANPSISRPPTSVAEDTKAFLEEVLYDRNAGLPELLGIDLSSYWETFRR